MQHDHLITWADRFGEMPHEELAARTAPIGDSTLPSGKIARGPKAVARVNSGRWIVDCPFCEGAELWNPETDIFFCCSCRNADAEGAYLRVQIPDAAIRSMVEEHLVRERPLKARHWEPGETLDDLRRQDAEARLIRERS